jgi:hypothetical protein
MADQNQNAVLNRVVVRVYRSLMQYAMECWPWTTAAETPGAEPPAEKAVKEMAARQQNFVAQIVDVLTNRGEIVDLDNFPDFSEMHYVSLDYLLGKLADDEGKLISELEAAQKALQGDAASGLVTELLAAEKENLHRLRGMTAKPGASAAA